MTVRTFLIGSFVVMAISWTIWGLIISWLNPKEAGMLGYLLFFLAFFLAIASISSLVGYGIRRIIAADQLPAYRVRHSLRQAVLLALFIDSLLLLQLMRVVRWWLVLITLILFVCIEFVFLSYDRASNRHRLTLP